MLKLEADKMTEKIFEVTCSSCGREFLMAGAIESVPCDLCLDCFVEKYGEDIEDEPMEPEAIC